MLVWLSRVDEIVILEQVCSESLFHQLQLCVNILLRRYDVAQCLVKVEVESFSVQFSDDIRCFSNDLSDIRFVLWCLNWSKLIWGCFCYLQESIAGHLHYSFVLFFHELEKFFYDCSQKTPVVSQEGRILADHVHDATCDDGFVLLAFFVLAKLKEGSQGRDEEGSLLSVLNASAKRANNPWQGIQSIKAETFRMLLFLNFLNNKFLHVRPVVLNQILTEFFLYLVQGCILAVDYLFPDWYSILVDYY